MEVGIVGLPSSGKTTLFNALTGAHAEAFGEKAHVGVAEIPDPNLPLIAPYFNPEKIVHGTLQLVDIPGVPPGSDPKKLNTFLEQIRQVEAICHVVRCFDDGSGKIDPAGDIADMETELVLADLIVAEGAQARAVKNARAGHKDAKERLALLERVVPVLEEGRVVRSIEDFSDAERLIVKSYGFVSAKPVLYVANVGEDDLDGQSEHARAVQEHAESAGSRSVAVCAQLESELGELEEADRAEMLESLGLTEPVVGPLARAANAVLGLTTFYTAGPKEVRAWACRAGASAPEAAGVIHSDMQRGFIRAECHSVDDLLQYKSEKAIKEAGKLRVEGKHYVIQEGDCVHFLFNV